MISHRYFYNEGFLASSLVSTRKISTVTRSSKGTITQQQSSEPLSLLLMDPSPGQFALSDRKYEQRISIAIEKFENLPGLKPFVKHCRSFNL